MSSAFTSGEKSRLRPSFERARLQSCRTENEIDPGFSPRGTVSSAIPQHAGSSAACTAPEGSPSLATPTIPASSDAGFQTARRINRSLTAAIEKQALQWMAVHAPRWLTSDQLTALGLCTQIGAGVCFAFSRYNRYALLLAILCIALNWFGDSLDGTLARVRRQQRPRYGFYVDHIVDIFGSVALMCGLGLSGFLHWQTAIAMLIAFLLLSSESYLATYTLSSFEMSQGIFGPTEIRILLIIGTLALLRSPYSTLFGHRMLLFDLGGVIAAIAMFAMAIAVTVRHTAELYRQELLP
jgi:archaetidylinositol phosphate synthase